MNAYEWFFENLYISVYAPSVNEARALVAATVLPPEYNDTETLEMFEGAKAAVAADEPETVVDDIGENDPSVTIGDAETEMVYFEG